MSESQNRRLSSWKEIASYLDHDVRTVIRWEKERGMPVHRVPGGQRHGVFAYSGEIDEWLHNGHPLDDDSPPGRPGGKVEPAFVFGMRPAADAAPASTRGQAPPSTQPLTASTRYPGQSEPAPSLPSIQLPVENRARSGDRTTYSAPIFNLSFPLLLKSALAVVAAAVLVGAITVYFGNKSQVRASTRVSSVAWKGERFGRLE